MTNTNETLAYENGRDAGYMEGYDDGFRAKIKTFTPKPNAAIVVSIDANKIDLDLAQSVFVQGERAFPNHTVLAKFDDTSIKSWGKDMLVDYVNWINEIIKEM